MSRTTIVPTAQTKANQATDFYLRADQSSTIDGNLTINGNLIMNDAGDHIICKVVGQNPGEVCISFNQVVGDVLRWGIGTRNAETGVGNTGNDFAIYAYSDTGNFLSKVLEITRSTGNVSITTELDVGDVASTGIINVVGASGPSQVYDAVYNRPGPVDYTYSINGYTLTLPPGFPTGTYVTGQQFTPTKTGMYLLEGLIGNGGVAQVAGYGDTVELVLVPTPIVPGVDPASSGVISVLPRGAVFAGYSSMSADKLVSGVTYEIYAYVTNQTGTMTNANDEFQMGFYITQLC